MKKYFVVLSLLLTAGFFSAKNLVSKNYSSAIKIQEPSGICLMSKSECAVVSDQGVLFKTDWKGNILARAKEEGVDFEDVCLAEGKLFVSDESTRRIFVYDSAKLELLKIIPIQNSAGRNEGFESITYNADAKKFILVSEKDPVQIVICNDEFQIENQIELHHIGDISSACYFNHKLFLLSDEDHAVFQFNAETFSLESKTSIPVNNPEGLAMTDNHSFLIVSDRMQKLFSFQIN